jgi:MFS family permease
MKGATEATALRRWQRAIVAAFGAGGITVAAWGPRLPTLRVELGIDTGTIGLLLGGVTVGAIVGFVVSTPVLYRLGSRRALTGALLGVAFGMTLLGAAVTLGSLPLVTVAFFAIGWASGMLDVLINVEGSAIEQLAGRTLMPLMHGAWSVGAAVGSGIGAACAALAISPQVQFIGEGVLIGVVAAVSAPAIPPGTRGVVGETQLDRIAKVRRWLRGWLDRRLLLIGVVMLGVELGEGSANNWLTLAVRNGHGQTAAVAAVFFTAFAIAEAAARILGSPVVDRLGRVRTIRYTTALGVVGVILFILGHSPWVVLAGVVLWALGVSMGFPLGMSAAAESGTNAAARVSVVVSVGYMANLAGPPAIGFLAQAVGLDRALWLIVALFVAAFAVSGSLRPAPAPPAV